MKTLKKKYLYILYCFFTICIFTKCSDNEGDSTFFFEQTNFQNEIEALLENLVFVGELDGFGPIDFSPLSQFSQLGSLNFATQEGFNFSDPGEGIIIDVSDFNDGGGILSINGRLTTFQFALCRTYGDLRREFPSFLPFQGDAFDRLIIFIAIGSNSFSVEEIFLGEAIDVEDFLIGFYDPVTNDFDGDFFTETGQFIFLVDGLASFDNNLLISEGDAFSFTDSNVQSYNLGLSCE
ncbi:MAG: hypothetical protein AAF363_09250 [Bacteroidota bacterium]